MDEEQAEERTMEGQDDDQRKEWREMFDYLDTDGSGQLDKNELEQLLFLLGQNPTPDDMEKFWNMVNKVDVDGDEKVGFEEFCAIMNSPTNAEEEMREALKHYDKNGDGCVDKEELKELLLQDGTLDENDDDLLELFDIVDKDKTGKIPIDTYIQCLQNPGAYE